MSDLTPERLALLNCRGVGESFTREDWESLQDLIKLAGDRLERIAALEAELQQARATIQKVASWLRSFSMPPTSTIIEKDEHLSMLEFALREAPLSEEPTK